MKHRRKPGRSEMAISAAPVDLESQAQCSGPRCNEHPYCPRHKPTLYADILGKHRLGG